MSEETVSKSVSFAQTKTAPASASGIAATRPVNPLGFASLARPICRTVCWISVATDLASADAGRRTTRTPVGSAGDCRSSSRASSVSRSVRRSDPMNTSELVSGSTAMVTSSPRSPVGSSARSGSGSSRRAANATSPMSRSITRYMPPEAGDSMNTSIAGSRRDPRPSSSSLSFSRSSASMISTVMPPCRRSIRRRVLAICSASVRDLSRRTVRIWRDVVSVAESSWRASPSISDICSTLALTIREFEAASTRIVGGVPPCASSASTSPRLVASSPASALFSVITRTTRSPPGPPSGSMSSPATISPASSSTGAGALTTIALSLRSAATRTGGVSSATPDLARCRSSCHRIQKSHCPVTSLSVSTLSTIGATVSALACFRKIVRTPISLGSAEISSIDSINSPAFDSLSAEAATTTVLLVGSAETMGRVSPAGSPTASVSRSAPATACASPLVSLNTRTSTAASPRGWSSVSIRSDAIAISGAGTLTRRRFVCVSAWIVGPGMFSPARAARCRPSGHRLRSPSICCTVCETARASACSSANDRSSTSGIDADRSSNSASRRSASAACSEGPITRIAPDPGSAEISSGLRRTSNVSRTIRVTVCASTAGSAFAGVNVSTSRSLDSPGWSRRSMTDRASSMVSPGPLTSSELVRRSASTRILGARRTCPGSRGGGRRAASGRSGRWSFEQQALDGARNLAGVGVGQHERLDRGLLRVEGLRVQRLDELLDLRQIGRRPGEQQRVRCPPPPARSRARPRAAPCSGPRR
jgi:hypothetical protein